MCVCVCLCVCVAVFLHAEQVVCLAGLVLDSHQPATADPHTASVYFPTLTWAFKVNNTFLLGPKDR